MKKFYIGKETLSISDNNHLDLKYYVLADECDEYTNYGIEIEKLDNTRIEKSQVMDITTDQTRIDDIVKSLMKNNVTPIHLHDVIVDML